MQRDARQAKILEIISSHEVETQDELCRMLEDEGFVVTQATISRDIKDMRLIKVAGSEKHYRYLYIGKGDTGLSSKMRTLFKEAVISIRSARNIVVIKTLSGNASTAGAVVDKLGYPEILGTVAGDDTVFSVCDSDENAEIIVERLNDFLK